MSRDTKKPKTTEQKAKRKKILWGTFWGTALSAVIATGIGVPIVQAKRALPKPTPILKDNDPILILKTPNGKTLELKYGDVDKVHELVNASKNIATNVEKNLTGFLYEQEYKGSLWYEAVYNADKTTTTEKKFALPSTDSIKRDKEKQINDVEKRFQEQYGVQKNWEEKFLQSLATNAYGNAKSKQEAIDYLVTQEQNKNAYRRYQTEVNTDWTYSELKQGIVANKDVYYTYDGKRIDIAKKGDTIRLSFAIENQNYVLPTDSDVQLKTDLKEQIKIPMFVTKSFIENQKNAEKYIAPWIEQKQGIVSDFNLSAHPDAKDATRPWIVTKSEVIKLLKYTALASNDPDKLILSLGIDGIKDFKGLTALLEQDTVTNEMENKAKNDQLLIRFVASKTDNVDSYGSQGFKSALSRINSKKPGDYLPVLSILLGQATNDEGIFEYQENDDLFKNLKDKFVEIIKPLDSDLATQLAKDPEEVNKTDDYVETYAKYGSKVEKLINNMSDSDFNKQFGEAFRDAFTANNEGNKINTLIKVNDNYLRVTASGILMQNVFKLTSDDVVKRLIKNDLAIQSKANYNPTLSKQIFNLSTIFSDILTKDYMVEDLLGQDDFKTYIKDQKFTLLDGKERKFTDEDIAKAITYESLLKQTNSYNLIDNKANEIKEYIKTQIDSNLYADYVYENNQFILKPHDNQDILKYLFNIIINKFILGQN